MTFHLLIADQSDLFLLGLRTTLAAQHGTAIVGEYQGVSTLLEDLTRWGSETTPTFLLLGDLAYHPPADESLTMMANSPIYLLDALHEIAALCGQLDCKLILMGTVDGWTIYQLLTHYSGVFGYLHKADALTDVIDDLFKSMEIGSIKQYLSPTARASYIQALKKINTQLDFDWRDQVLLESIASGVSIGTICRLLDISERTYQRALETLRIKLKAKSNPHMVSQAFRLGILQFSDTESA